jgi:hypothetical protein
MAEISNERSEELRGYLEEWLERPVTFEEAKEIGDGFVDFYELLMRLDTEEDEEDDGDVI